MKIEQTQPIDELYLIWLKEVADYYDNDLNEMIKHIIWKEWHEVNERKELIERHNKKTDENCIQQTSVHIANQKGD